MYNCFIKTKIVERWKKVHKDKNVFIYTKPFSHILLSKLSDIYFFNSCKFVSFCPPQSIWNNSQSLFLFFKPYKLCWQCLLTSKLLCWFISEWTIRTWYFCSSYRIKALVICSTDFALKINYFIKYMHKSAWQEMVFFFIWKKWRFSNEKEM